MTTDTKSISQAAIAAAAQAGRDGTNGKGAPVHVTYAPDFASNTQYADGVHSVGLRGGVAHIDLYQTVMPGNEKQNQPEQRVITHRLALPLVAFAEIQKLLNSMRDAVQAAVKQQEAEKTKQ